MRAYGSTAASDPALAEQASRLVLEATKCTNTRVPAPYPARCVCAPERGTAGEPACGRVTVRDDLRGVDLRRGYEHGCVEHVANQVRDAGEVRCRARREYARGERRRVVWVEREPEAREHRCRAALRRRSATAVA